MLASLLEALAKPECQKRATQKPHACMYNTYSIPIVTNSVCVHQWLLGT
ncbi:MAG: hypothetical protein IKK64_01645 [Bacteroidales bacterium]|nr:hypothetical protein [Bacteroidales bacterium]